MPARTYGQACPLARALDLIGERWTMLVLRELAAGPRRFGELLEGLPGISTNLLATRLARLDAAGVVDRASDGRRWELSERGEALRPAIGALTRWGIETLGLDDEFLRGTRPRVAISVAGLTAHLDGGEARDLPTPLELHAEGERVIVDAGPSGVEVRDGVTAGAPRLVAHCDRGVLLLLAGGHLDPEAAIAAGVLRVEGTLEDLRAWVAAMSVELPLSAGIAEAIVG